jgi:outer membrane lipase/esterase
MKFRTSALRALCVGVLSTLLVSCGGEELVPFSPARLIVFGDQASAIVAGTTPADGRKYTINYADDTTGAVDCGRNPIWVQVLAITYNISFPECPFPVDAAMVGQIRALDGATAGGNGVIDLTAQITRQIELGTEDGGGINNSDLVTVFAGINDVVAAFDRYKAGGSFDTAVAEVEAAGETLAAQVNRIAAAGGRVIVSTVPNVCLTPYGVANRSQLVCSESEGELLSVLTARINARFLVSINNNGRLIGLIELNPYLASVVENPLAYGYLDVREAACVPAALLTCTNKTLQPDATSYNWLWAGPVEMSPGAHAQLGSLAASRAVNQPF